MSRFFRTILPSLALGSSLALGFSVAPAFAQAPGDVRPAEAADLVGAWETVPYPPGLGSQFNNTQAPPFEYIVILPDGRINILAVQQKRPDLKQRELLRIIEPNPWNRYQMRVGMLTILYPRIPGLQESWTAHIVDKPFMAGGVAHEAGDMIMSRGNALGGVDRYRLMRRLPE